MAKSAITTLYMVLSAVCLFGLMVFLTCGISYEAASKGGGPDGGVAITADEMRDAKKKAVICWVLLALSFIGFFGFALMFKKSNCTDNRMSMDVPDRDTIDFAQTIECGDIPGLLNDCDIHSNLREVLQRRLEVECANRGKSGKRSFSD